MIKYLLKVRLDGVMEFCLIVELLFRGDVDTEKYVQN